MGDIKLLWHLTYDIVNEIIIPAQLIQHTHYQTYITILHVTS